MRQVSHFFAPTDYVVNNYVQAKTRAIQNVDPNKKWTVDSIIKYELKKFADSLDIYIAKENLINDILIAKGKKYNNVKGGEFIVSYEETEDPNLGYNPNSSVVPKVVYFTYLFKPIGNDFDVTKIVDPIGNRILVQTSNAQTTTGVVHVLNNAHNLFFYR